MPMVQRPNIGLLGLPHWFLTWPLLLTAIQHFSNHNIRIMSGLHFPVRWGWRNIWFQNNSFPKVVFKWFFTNQCYFYLTSNCNTSIGGKYLRRMDQVGETVSNVSEKVGRRPLAVFFISDDKKIRSYYDFVSTSVIIDTAGIAIYGHPGYFLTPPSFFSWKVDAFWLLFDP